MKDLSLAQREEATLIRNTLFRSTDIACSLHILHSSVEIGAGTIFAIAHFLTQHQRSIPAKDHLGCREAAGIAFLA